MSEEAKTQSEAPAQTSTEAPAVESTLDDVYSKYNVEDTAQQFSAQPEKQPQQHQQQQPQAQPVQDAHVSIPDPTLDPAGYKSWETARYRDQQSLRQALHSVAGKLNAYEQAAARQAEEADIKRAVEQVNGHLGESKLDPDVVEISLGAEARRDARFQVLWNNRHKNPKAFQEGIKAFSSKLAKKFSMRADPQIAENQRALKEATSTKATTTPEDSETDRIGKLTGSAFDRALDKFRASH
jgi:hypothetical protein